MLRLLVIQSLYARIVFYNTPGFNSKKKSLMNWSSTMKYTWLFGNAYMVIAILEIYKK